MIALVAQSDEALAQRLRDQLEQEGHTVCVLDWADILLGQGLSWWVPPQTDASKSLLLTKQKVLRFAEIKAVVYLPSNSSVLPPDQEWEPEDRAYINKEVSATILGILHSLNCPVVNLPPANGRPRLFFASACSKKLLLQQGLRLPPMTVVTCLQLGKTWMENLPGPFRVGSLEDLNELGHGLIEHPQPWWDVSQIPFPVFLQQVPAGKIYHLIIVGPSVLGGKVSPEKFDGSFHTQVEPDDLPPTLIHKCVDLARSFRLSFSECLITEGPEGNWICLDWSSLPRLSNWGSAMEEPVISKFVQLLTKNAVRT